MLLTNGTLLTDERLRAYRAAGLGRVALHVDSRQRGRPDAPAGASEAELNALRRRLAERCAAAGLDVTLVLTAYRDTLPGLPAVIDLCLAAPEITSLLVIGYSDRIDRRRRGTEGAEVGIADLRRAVAEAAGAEPVWFVPSEHDDRAERWIFYQVAVTADRAGRVEPLWWAPRDRAPLWLFPRLVRLLRGRYHFDPPLTTRQRALVTALYGLLSLRPATLARVAAFLAAAWRNRRLKTCTLVFQEPPSLRPDGVLDACRDCPDATVRGGALVPICLADRLHPLARPGG